MHSTVLEHCIRSTMVRSGQLLASKSLHSPHRLTAWPFVFCPASTIVVMVARAAKTYVKRIAVDERCERGVDVYFESVGWSALKCGAMMRVVVMEQKQETMSLRFDCPKKSAKRRNVS